jgi:hypothetical protein
VKGSPGLVSIKVEGVINSVIKFFVFAATVFSFAQFHFSVCGIFSRQVVNKSGYES